MKSFLAGDAFADRTAVLIGGGTGIGFAVARLVVSGGGAVVLGGRRAGVQFHLQRVTLLDQYVEPVEERREGVGTQSGGRMPDEEVGIEFGDPAHGGGRLVEADVENRCGNAVEIGHAQRVEIGEPQLAAEPRYGERVSDEVARAESDDADAEAAQPVLFAAGGQMPVAVQTQSAIRPRSQQLQHRRAPRVVDPAGGLVEEIGRRCRPEFGQRGELVGPGVHGVHRRVAQQRFEGFRVGGVLRVEDRDVVSVQSWHQPATSLVDIASISCSAFVICSG